MDNTLKPLVLLVDDMPANVQVLANCLKDRYRLKVANSGERCIEVAELEPHPDLILLDIDMPELGGLEVCRRLKKDPQTSNIPIIFVTSKNTQDDEEKGLEVGAVDYITKPIRPAIVRARVNTQVSLKRQNDQLHQMALFDQLTGLYNRWYLFEIAEHKFSRVKRHSHELSIIMLDIDHFKRINDQHGHPTGDQVLKEVALSLKNCSRGEDVVGRFGGEEFIVLLEHCSAEAVLQKAESIRVQIEGLMPCDLKITMSLGVTSFNSTMVNFSQMLKIADDALYQAKDHGRNQVIYWCHTQNKYIGIDDKS